MGTDLYAYRAYVAKPGAGLPRNRVPRHAAPTLRRRAARRLAAAAAWLLLPAVAAYLALAPTAVRSSR